MIDTKELRVSANMFEAYYGKTYAEHIRNAADELDRLYLDTAPLSREELETVLKEAGWEWNENGREYSKGHESIWRDKERFFCEKLATTYILPLSAVTRRLLRDCGVIA